MILSIDDDEDILSLIETFLAGSGYNIITADSTGKGMEVIRNQKPDLILLDVIMPEMNGYEFCANLQKNEETAYIPVIFVTALGKEEDRVRAFSVGAADYLVKPIVKDVLITKVDTQIKTSARWKELAGHSSSLGNLVAPSSFAQFKDFLSDQLTLESGEKEKLLAMTPSQIYSGCSGIGISEPHMARYVAGFLKLRYASLVDPENIQLGALPTSFCLAKRVVPVVEESGERAVVLSNPFDWELLESLDTFMGGGRRPNLFVSEPGNILPLFEQGANDSVESPLLDIPTSKDKDKRVASDGTPDLPESQIQNHPIRHIASRILHKAAFERASDIHIEPKKTDTVVRFRIDGEMTDVLTIKSRTLYVKQ